MKLLRLPKVIEATTMCKASIYRLVKKGEFPAPIKIGERAVAWKEEEVTAWIESRERVSYIE